MAATGGIDIVVDRRQLAALERRLRAVGAKGEREFQRGMVSTQRFVGTDARRAVVEVYHLTQKRVGQDLFVRGSNGRNTGFTLRGRKKPISFESYGARGLKRGGVRVQVLRGKTRLIAQAFAGNSPSGKRLTWIRTGKPKAKARQGRYAGVDYLREPIRALTGPSVADHLNHRTVRARIDRTFLTRHRTEMLRRLERLFRTGTANG